VVAPPEHSQGTNLVQTKAYHTRIFAKIPNLGFDFRENACKEEHEDEQFKLKKYENAK
jgi:hypothetical protein